MADPSDSNSCYATITIDDVQVFSNKNFACQVLETDVIAIYVGGGSNAAEDVYASLSIGGLEWLGDTAPAVTTTPATTTPATTTTVQPTTAAETTAAPTTTTITTTTSAPTTSQPQQAETTAAPTTTEMTTTTTTTTTTTVGWGAWSEWGACTLTCGSGTRTRTRSRAAGEDENEVAACNTDSCRKC